MLGKNLQHYFITVNENMIKIKIRNMKSNKYLKPKSQEEIGTVVQNMELLKDQDAIEGYFFEGIVLRNRYYLMQAIKSGLNVNEPGSDGIKPIVQAALYDNTEAFKFLIDLGAILDQQLIDKIYEIAILQNGQEVFKISHTLAEMNLKPSSECLRKLSKRVTRYIIKSLYSEKVKREVEGFFVLRSRKLRSYTICL